MEIEIKEVKKTLSQIAKYCGHVTPGACKHGRCKYSHSQYACIFEAMNMNSPYDWDLDEGGEG